MAPLGRLLRLEKASAERIVQLSDEQVEAIERFSPEFRKHHIEAHYSGDLLAVDTFYACPERSRRVGHVKGAGKIYLQSAIDCCSRLAWGRLYTNKMPLTAVHLLNTHVLPTFEARGIPIKTVLSDNGREFCGRPGRHPYELFLQLEGIEHRRTRVKRPQPNGIACPERSRRVERFHRTLLDAHFRVEGRRTWFETVEEMQSALDAYLVTYNTGRSHRGCGMDGFTPWRAFLDRVPATENLMEDTDRKNDQAAWQRPGQLLSADCRLRTERVYRPEIAYQRLRQLVIATDIEK